MMPGVCLIITIKKNCHLNLFLLILIGPSIRTLNIHNVSKALIPREGVGLGKAWNKNTNFRLKNKGYKPNFW